MALNNLFSRLSVSPIVLCQKYIHTSSIALASKPNIVLPKPGGGKSYRRIVHFPEEYTVKPLEVTNLAGRDPVTGRVVAKGIGGGIKHKYHWIAWKRDGPEEGPPLIEKVIQIMEDGCRTANIALVAVGDHLKYILASENMKAGDLLKTSRNLPRIPDIYTFAFHIACVAVRASEGDAYLLGALPAGTVVHNIEKTPGSGAVYVHAAGSGAAVLRREGARVLVQMPSKHVFSFDERCMAVVGRLSNVEHSSTPIGSAQRNRWLGNRPRSGLWQRKDGRHGRKVKPPKPVRLVDGSSRRTDGGGQLTMHY